MSIGDGYFTIVGKQELYATETDVKCKFFKYRKFSLCKYFNYQKMFSFLVYLLSKLHLL